MSLIEQEFLKLIAQIKFTLPKVVGIPRKIQPHGSLIYNTLNDQVYFSNGTSWILLTSGIFSIIAGTGVTITGTASNLIINLKELLSSDSSIINTFIGEDTNIVVNDINTFEKYHDAFPKNTGGIFGTVYGSGASWTGSVYAPSTGKIYGIPRTKDHVIVIDPGAKTTSMLCTFGVGDKWAGGVLAPNGKIYCPPIFDTVILIIDPVANTVDTTITGFVSGEKWQGACLAPNGKIYTSPVVNNNEILVIDPILNTYTTFLSTPIGRWSSPVLAPNGKLYCTPFNITTTDVLIIEPATNTSSLMGLSPINNDSATSVIHPNGKIYCIPHNSTDVLVIDTISNTFYYMGAILPGSSKWIGGILTPSGDIYGIPTNSRDLLVIHTGLDTVEVIPNVFSSQTLKFFGGTLAPDGSIYTIPWDNPQVGYITTGPPADFTSGINHTGIKMQVPWEYCLSKYFIIILNRKYIIIKYFIIINIYLIIILLLLNMSYSVVEVYSLSLQDMESCIIPCNADPNNINYPSVQLGTFSAVTDNINEELIPYCVPSNLVPNNPIFSDWKESLEKIIPFSYRVPINVRIYKHY